MSVSQIVVNKTVYSSVLMQIEKKKAKIAKAMKELKELENSKSKMKVVDQRKKRK